MAKAKVAAVAEEIKNEEEEHSVEEPEKRQEDRQKEWGQQFHKWLINAARRGNVVEFVLSQDYPGISKDGNIVSGIPKRIDKDFVQVVVDQQEAWVQLKYVIGCKVLGSPAKVSAEGVEV